MEAEEALALVSGKVDQELLLRNEYLAAENEIMRSKIPGRVPMTDSERKHLAELGHKLGRKALADVAAIVKPDTILAWYRRLIAAKFDGTANRGRAGGRPHAAQHANFRRYLRYPAEMADSTPPNAPYPGDSFSRLSKRTARSSPLILRAQNRRNRTSGGEAR